MVAWLLCVESPVWCLRSALGTALGTVNLCLDPLCLCLLSLSTSRPLSALAEGGGTCRLHPHPGLPTEPGGLTHSPRLLPCQVGAEIQAGPAEAEWGRADRWEGHVTAEGSVRGHGGRDPQASTGGCSPATFMAPRSSHFQSHPPAGI